MADYNNSDSKEIAYDLRQRFAQQIGDLRDRIIDARDNRDYKNWYNYLDSLFIEISHKLKLEEKKEFNAKVETLNKVIQSNRGAYEGKGDSSLIYIHLRGMNIWLQDKMEEKDIFGSIDKTDYGGL